MNKENIRRRKWAFEKGRNSSCVMFAVLVTAGVVVLLTLTLRYGFTPQSDRRQTTELSLIAKNELNTLQLIREFDPAETYRINSGGYPFCMNCRRSHENFCTSDDVKEFIVQVENAVGSRPDIRSEIYSGNIKLPENRPAEFPVSTGLAAVLPGGAVQAAPQLCVVNEKGEEADVDKSKLAALNADGKQNITVLEISDPGLVANVKIIASSGSRNIDMQAANILKAQNLKPGIYTIYWAGRRIAP